MPSFHMKNLYQTLPVVSTYRSRRRRLSRRKPIKKRGKKLNVKREINKLKRQVVNVDGRAVLDYRLISAGTVAVSQNVSTDQFLALNSLANLEDVLGQLRYFDPSSPATLVVSDFTAGTYFKEVMFVRCTLEMEIRSNYLTPTHVTAYDCRVRRDTASSPSSAFTQGDTDTSNKTFASVCLYPTDIPLVNDLWKLKKVYDGIIPAGGSRKVKIIINKSFKYDPSLSDSQNLQYQKTFMASGVYLRYHGALAHDTSLNEQGLQGAQIDYLIKRTWKVRYDGGADIKFIFIDDDGLTTMANASQVCASGNPRVNITNPVNP